MNFDFDIELPFLSCVVIAFFLMVVVSCVSFLAAYLACHSVC